MAVVKYNNEEIALLARLMRAEAEGDGKMGMLLVGNVGINRVRGNCLDFKNINTITKWFINHLAALKQLLNHTLINEHVRLTKS